MAKLRAKTSTRDIAVVSTGWYEVVWVVAGTRHALTYAQLRAKYAHVPETGLQQLLANLLQRTDTDDPTQRITTSLLAPGEMPQNMAMLTLISCRISSVISGLSPATNLSLQLGPANLPIVPVGLSAYMINC
jgi:hypothetical protein